MSIPCPPGTGGKMHCRPAVAHWFDPPEQGTDWRTRIQLAMSLCETCPLVNACLEAGQNGEESGVWGAQLLDEGRPVVFMHEPDGDLRAAHTAYQKGIRTPEVIRGETTYQRRSRQRRKAAA